VDPGSYRITFSAPGYAKQDYGQRTIGESGIPLTLTLGQAKSDIVMRMLRVGAVSGRIQNGAGLPVVGVPVELLRVTYDATGRRRNIRVAATRTDDLGQYRLFNLSPGRYFLSAGGLAGPTQGEPRDSAYSTPNGVPQYYRWTYDPSGTDEAAAAPIDLQPGADFRGIDLLLKGESPYRIRGRVIDSKTGQPPPRVNFSLNLQDSGIRGSANLLVSNPNYRAADGSFELQNINAGSFFLTASVPDSSPTPRPDINTLSRAEQEEFRRALEEAELRRPKTSHGIMAMPITAVIRPPVT
jgi:hypothetical protein